MKIENSIQPMLEQDLEIYDAITLYLYDLQFFVQDQEITRKQIETMDLAGIMQERKLTAVEMVPNIRNFIKNMNMADTDLKEAWKFYMLKTGNVYTILLKQYGKRIATMKNILVHAEQVINLINLKEFSEPESIGLWGASLCVEIKRCIQFVSEKVEINGVDLMTNFRTANKHQSLDKLKISGLITIILHYYFIEENKSFI